MKNVNATVCEYSSSSQDRIKNGAIHVERSAVRHSTRLVRVANWVFGHHIRFYPRIIAGILPWSDVKLFKRDY
jgi:hypothetical protein